MSIVTYGTTHLTMDEFVDAFENASAGSSFRYAFGDISCSAHESAELRGLRELAWKANQNKRAYLTQRRHADQPFPSKGGACFEYIITKASAAALAEAA